MKDLRNELRFKNAALLRAIEEQFQHLTLAAYNSNPGLLVKVATLIGVPYSRLSQLVNLKLSPWRKDGSFKRGALEIAEALGRDPIEIFPPAVYSGRFASARSTEVESQAFLPLCHKDAFLLSSCEDHTQEVQESIDAVMKTLKPREEKILNMRFGRNGYEPMTLQEIGGQMNLSKDRIRQIEAKALRKLCHPSRSNVLREAIEGTEFNVLS